MIWGCHYFWKHPYRHTYTESQKSPFTWTSVLHFVPLLTDGRYPALFYKESVKMTKKIPQNASISAKSSQIWVHTSSYFIEFIPFSCHFVGKYPTSSNHNATSDLWPMIVREKRFRFTSPSPRLVPLCCSQMKGTASTFILHQSQEDRPSPKKSWGEGISINIWVFPQIGVGPPNHPF